MKVMTLWGEEDLEEGKSKICAVCEEEKPLTEFSISNTSTGAFKRKFRTKECVICRNKSVNAKNRLMKTAPPKSKTCDICDDPGKKYFDHCHKELKFRGWLCNNCNTGLGKFKDNIEILGKAIKYLSE
jgi:hypothetical protein